MQAEPSPRLSRRGLMVLLPVPLLLTVPGIVSAAGEKVAFKAASVGVAKEATTVMKVAKALRESKDKIDSGDAKGMTKFLTSQFLSNTAAYLKNTRTLESLAKDLEPSPDSRQVQSQPPPPSSVRRRREVVPPKRKTVRFPVSPYP